MALWPVPEAAADRLALAYGYPFAIPEESYLFRKGGPVPLPAGLSLRQLIDSGRHAVLAVGSNQSPEQLQRKFASQPGPQEIPVTRVWLDGFDVVYATHITRYGSIPGNLHPAPGCRVRLSVTWLDAAQLALMHETELAGESYVYARLDGLSLDHFDGSRAERIDAYVSRHGATNAEGKPLALAAIRAERRSRSALDQRAALARLQRLAGDDGSLDEFLLAAIDDPQRRGELTRLMRRDALPFSWPHFTLLAGR